jgi:hypothetical protein
VPNSDINDEETDTLGNDSTAVSVHDDDTIDSSHFQLDSQEYTQTQMMITDTKVENTNKFLILKMKRKMKRIL